MKTIERLFRLAVFVWILVVVFWQPEPPVSFADVPSVVPYPEGHRIFYELVKKQTAQVNRNLRKVSALDAEVEVLVIMSPSRGISLKEREALTEWIMGGPRALVVGYPIRDEEGELLSSILSPESEWQAASRQAIEPEVAQYMFTGDAEFTSRKVPDFNQRTSGVMVLGSDESDEEETTGILVKRVKDGAVLISEDQIGMGRIIQIADNSVLANEAMGFKRTHLLAAALLDGIGRDRVWSFDESHEGISVQPELAPLIGASRFRLFFLYVILVVIFGYWWWSSRLGRPVPAPNPNNVGDVKTLARDIGDFYFRARKSRWALEQSSRYFRYFLSNRAVSPQERGAGLALLEEVDATLASTGVDVGRDTALIRAMTELMRSMSATE